MCQIRLHTSRTPQGSTIRRKLESLTCLLKSELLENDLFDIGDDYVSVNLLKTLELYTLNRGIVWRLNCLSKQLFKTDLLGRNLAVSWRLSEQWARRGSSKNLGASELVCMEPPVLS